MGFVGSGDSYELYGIDGEEVVDCADDAGVRVELGGGVAGALDDGGEMQALYGLEDGGVEAAAAQAETD